VLLFAGARLIAIFFLRGISIGLRLTAALAGAGHARASHGG
jgi:hypothetical protein